MSWPCGSSRCPYRIFSESVSGRCNLQQVNNQRLIRRMEHIPDADNLKIIFDALVIDILPWLEKRHWDFSVPNWRGNSSHASGHALCGARSISGLCCETVHQLWRRRKKESGAINQEVEDTGQKRTIYRTARELSLFYFILLIVNLLHGARSQSVEAWTT